MLFALSEQQAHSAYYAEQERAVAMWVYHNNKQAGATTNTLGSAQCRYLAVRVGQDIFGVVGIALRGVPLDAFENSIVLSILGECALALQNKKISQEREKAALLAKNEQLRADLLRSISHDLRTPLTSISGSAGILLAGEEQIAPEKRRQLYGDIYDDALWLINLVENLLWTLIRKTPNKRKLSQMTMALLFLQLLGYTETLETEDSEEAAVLKVLRYVESNYGSGSLSEAAELLHYDLSWLSREIKRRTGKTYTQIVQEKRLAQAAFLLKNTDRNVADIAVAVGYENISYFHRIFTAAFGMSPKHYRDSM